MSPSMKEIILIIRPEKWRDTQRAAMEAGAQGITQHRALGRGRQSGLFYAGGEGRTAVMDYLPKRMVTCIIDADKADALVDAVIRVNQTGNPGDGKLFVCPVQDAWRVRTEERGVPAVS